jgi:hypothetical protein
MATATSSDHHDDNNTTATAATDNTATAAIINELINQLTHHRKSKQLKEADQLKKLLYDKYSIQVFYRRNGTIGWRVISNDTKLKVGNALSFRDCGMKVVWSMVDNVVDVTHDIRQQHHDGDDDDIPLYVATVDTPYYRSRLAETMDHLSLFNKDDTHHHDSTRQFHPINVIDLLNLEEYPSLGTNRILFEGWRQILLPKLILDGSCTSSSSTDKRIILVGEDDIRLVTSPSVIWKVCQDVFDKNLDLHILSLGHGYSPTKLSKRQRRRRARASQEPQAGSSESCLNNVNCEECDVDDESSCKYTSCPLFNHLERGKGIHGTTLLALRYPEGVVAMLEAMEAIPLRKRGHFDQFLFHSTQHNLSIAVSDPPLVGWAEVTHTLTSSGSGNRRIGGGRLEHLPEVTPNFDVKWVRRTLINGDKSCV